MNEQPEAVPYVDPIQALNNQRNVDPVDMNRRGDYAVQIFSGMYAANKEGLAVSLEVTKQLAFAAVDAADVLMAELARTAHPSKRRINR